MSRAKHITDFERDCIRIGLHHGLSGPQIAAFLGRHTNVIYAQRDKMRDNGTLENLPLDFMTEEIAEAIRRGARRNG